MKTNSPKNKKGFTLIELVIYVAGLLILSSVLILMIVQFYSLYKEIIVIPRSDRTGLTLVDRITKEIRAGDQIDAINSQFGTTNGVLDFDTTETDGTHSKRFYVEDGKVKYQLDNETPVTLTPSGLYVSNFYFISTPTAVSQGVKFNLELQFETRNGTDTKSYTGFAILRESYE